MDRQRPIPSPSCPLASRRPGNQDLAGRPAELTGTLASSPQETLPAGLHEHWRGRRGRGAPGVGGGGGGLLGVWRSGGSTAYRVRLRNSSGDRLPPWSAPAAASTWFPGLWNGLSTDRRRMRLPCEQNVHWRQHRAPGVPVNYVQPRAVMYRPSSLPTQERVPTQKHGAWHDQVWKVRASTQLTYPAELPLNDQG